MERIEELIRELPPELHREVEDFVEFLLEKRLKRPRVKPNLGPAHSRTCGINTPQQRGIDYGPTVEQFLNGLDTLAEDFGVEELHRVAIEMRQEEGL